MSLLNDIEDVFSGGGGSQAQGTPTTAGAGDGGKNTAITSWLSDITGVYNAVTGSGQKSGPAPAPQVTKPASGPNLVMYGGIALGILVLLWVVLRKKR